jgi:hypothetical protein
MGKLGARELNVSSDIDLIYVYDEDGETEGLEDGRGRISHHEYFGRCVKLISALLADVTEHGFVFRIDLARRPHGNSGPPAIPLGALEDYLQLQGREWERFAWLKSRVVAPQAAIADGSARALRGVVLSEGSVSGSPIQPTKADLPNALCLAPLADCTVSSTKFLAFENCKNSSNALGLVGLGENDRPEESLRAWSTMKVLRSFEAAVSSTLSLPEPSSHMGEVRRTAVGKIPKPAPESAHTPDRPMGNEKASERDHERDSCVPSLSEPKSGRLMPTKRSVKSRLNNPEPSSR